MITPCHHRTYERRANYWVRDFPRLFPAAEKYSCEAAGTSARAVAEKARSEPADYRMLENYLTVVQNPDAFTVVAIRQVYVFSAIFHT